MDLMTRYRAMAGVKKGGILPAGYTEDPYLTSTDYRYNGYINTGIVCGNGYCAEVEFRLTSYDAYYENGIFGASEGANANSQGLAVRDRKLVYAVTQDRVQLASVPIELNTWYNVKFSTSQGNHFLYVDNVLVYSSTATVSYSISRAIDLFRTNNMQGFKGDIRKTIIYGQSSIPLTMPTDPVYNAIFCHRDSDNVAGVYDVVSGIFTARKRGEYGGDIIAPTI